MKGERIVWDVVNPLSLEQMAAIADANVSFGGSYGLQFQADDADEERVALIERVAAENDIVLMRREEGDRVAALEAELHRQQRRLQSEVVLAERKRADAAEAALREREAELEELRNLGIGFKAQKLAVERAEKAEAALEEARAAEAALRRGLEELSDKDRRKVYDVARAFSASSAAPPAPPEER